MGKHLVFTSVLVIAMLAIGLFLPGFDAGSPSFLAILPPVLAIAAAFILREVLISLFLGILVGAWLLNGSNLSGFWLALVKVPSLYTVTALYDGDHLKIILLTLFIGGMMSVIYHNGGMGGLVKLISRWATTNRRGQLSTALMGLVIFFDDYSNSLVVGNTMRPLTDSLKISREKLAYLVDSTAAPVASIAVISLWVGFQVGLIEAAIGDIPALAQPFLLYLHSIAFSFYPILTLVFVFMIVLSGKDFGPMLLAERRALTHGVAAAETRELKVSSAANALIPILVLIGTVVATLFLSGSGADLREVLASADPFLALLLGGFFGSIVAIIISAAKGILPLQEALDAWIAGMHTVTVSLVILVLSWSLALITKEMNTAQYLVAVLGDAIPYSLFPAAVFVIAALISLGTGTSWGTMAILMPLTIPLCWQLIDADMNHLDILYASISAVLAGSVWGDHCSPISDTTILSSMASQCIHIEHVRTQMPYAIVVGLVAVFVGLLPVGLGLPWWLAMLGSGLLLYLILHFWGRSAAE